MWVGAEPGAAEIGNSGSPATSAGNRERGDRRSARSSFKTAPRAADRQGSFKQIRDAIRAGKFENIGDIATMKAGGKRCSRIVEFVDALPKSGTGKVQWRALQDAEMATPAA